MFAVYIAAGCGLKITTIRDNAVFHEKIGKAYMYTDKINVIIGIDLSDKKKKKSNGKIE